MSTAPERIKRQIILGMRRDDYLGDVDTSEVDWDQSDWITPLWDELVAAGLHWEYMEDFRTEGEPTGLGCEWSRHYESEAVGKVLKDGTAVGWTHWFGGGKHGEPGAIPWIDDAYDLDHAKETRVVTAYSKPGKGKLGPVYLIEDSAQSFGLKLWYPADGESSWVTFLDQAAELSEAEATAICKEKPNCRMWLKAEIEAIAVSAVPVEKLNRMIAQRSEVAS